MAECHKAVAFSVGPKGVSAWLLDASLEVGVKNIIMHMYIA
jgi:hypothetical protein